MSNDTNDTNAPETPGRAPARTPADKAEAAQAAKDEAARKKLAAEQAKPEGKYELVLRHGTYVGPGCPNPNARKGSFTVEHKLGPGRFAEELIEYDHSGFQYDHKHPAQPGERVTGLSRKRAKEMLLSKAFETVAEYEARQARNKTIDVDALLGPDDEQETRRKPMRVVTHD